MNSIQVTTTAQTVHKLYAVDDHFSVGFGSLRGKRGLLMWANANLNDDYRQRVLAWLNKIEAEDNEDNS